MDVDNEVDKMRILSVKQLDIPDAFATFAPALTEHFIYYCKTCKHNQGEDSVGGRGRSEERGSFGPDIPQPLHGTGVWSQRRFLCVWFNGRRSGGRQGRSQPPFSEAPPGWLFLTSALQGLWNGTAMVCYG